jgi:hypothetical protein
VADSGLITIQRFDGNDDPCFIAWQVDARWPFSAS